MSTQPVDFTQVPHLPYEPARWITIEGGRDIYDCGNGFWWDPDVQQWYFTDVPPSTPITPPQVRRRQFVRRLKQRPRGIFMAGWDAWRDAPVVGTLIVMPITWACRIYIVCVSIFTVSNCTYIWQGLPKVMMSEVQIEEAGQHDRFLQHAAVLWLFLMLGFLAAWMILGMVTLNPEQQAALAVVLTAHNAYQAHQRHQQQMLNEAARVGAQERYRLEHLPAPRPGHLR